MVKKGLDMKITAIILAAGQGKRFGKPKWQAVYEDKSFLDIIVSKLKAVEVHRIRCVLREEADPKREENIEYIINKSPELGMFSSIYYGIQNISTDTEGILIWPVDHPFVEIETLSNLIRSFEINPTSIIKPIFEGRGGHPVILPENIFKKINTIDYQGGLRQFLSNINAKYNTMNTNDRSILRNINTVNDII